MSGELPSMVYADGIRKATQVKFGGYNHTRGAGDGELWDMRNLTGDHYPVLSAREPRWLCRTLARPNGFFAGDGLYWVDGTDFYADGAKAGTVADGRKRFAALGAYVIILPDLCYYNRLTGEFGNLGAAWSGAVTIEDGTFAGEAATGNAIRAPGADWATLFHAGDGVTITGCAIHPENNKTIVIREIDGDCLRFYENSFTISQGGDGETVTVARRAPALEHVCANENRLWGCGGDTIYASKLGDPFNWDVFDGVATDSFAVNVGSAGDFTGCVSYRGYPVFFKEEHIYKVYGDRPSNFQVMGSASLGVEAGSHGSLAIAGEVLFYLSRAGIVAYSGGVPQSVAAPFGADRYRDAVAGSDGVKYRVSMRRGDGTWALFVYDTRTSLWHREDETEAVGFGWDGELYFLAADGKLWLDGSARAVPDGAETEGAVDSAAEFGDFIEGHANYKGVTKLQIRVELDAGARVEIHAQFDSDGVWRAVKTLEATVKRSYYLPIIPRRADHFRIRFTGSGGWRLYSLARESYTGSGVGATS